MENDGVIPEQESSSDRSAPGDDPPHLSEETFQASFVVPNGRLLPATCPLCGADGVRARKVTVDGGQSSAQLEAHYCEICAEFLAHRTTRSLALLGAVLLVLLSIVTFLTLKLGTRDLALQIAIPILLALALAGWSFKFRSTATETGLLAHAKGESASTLLVTQPTFSAALSAAGFKETEPFDSLLSRRRALGIFVLLTLGGLVWLSLVQTLGSADVRVLKSGLAPGVFLVDHRHAGVVHPSNSEDPRAGMSARVLGGRRTLAVVGLDGSRVASKELTVWPGRTYIVGQLGEGQCLFWEKRAYGAAGVRHTFLPLPGHGPIWELKMQVDSWFQPLGEPGAPDPSLGGSGGVRRAIRLLPCRGL